MAKLCKYLLVYLLLLSGSAQASFDHSEWDQLLKRHVHRLDEGASTAVDYQGMLQDNAALKTYLARLSAVNSAQFNDWDKHTQLAFLINAYNAWTVQLVVEAWPDLNSIKDLGNWFRSPWQRRFIPLLGQHLSLDDIEHELIRGSGRYKEPRIHFAVNCASISCPALRQEAYVGQRLTLQLEQQTLSFLGDRQFNRLEQDTLFLSSIFKWYREDFERGWLGLDRLEGFLINYGDALGLSSAQQTQLLQGDLNIEFLDYDWRLNRLP